MALIARSYLSCAADPAMATFVSHAEVGTQPMPLSERRSLSSESVAAALWSMRMPFTPIGTHFGFVPPPAEFYFILGAMVVVYLLAVELAKQLFYRWAAARSH